MSSKVASRIAAVAAAALIGIAGVASAQPRHGHGGDFVMAIAALKDQLNLNTSQQVMWDNAVAASKSAREAARTNMQSVREALKAELAKPEPDLAAVARAADTARNTGQAAHQQARDAWLSLYATFTPDQKTIVKNALQQRLSRMEQFRERMRERHSQGG